MGLPSDARWSLAALTERRRPHRYAEVVGQEEAARVLRTLAGEPNLQRRGRSVLLIGPDGVGKTSLAEMYAGALLCQTQPADSAGEACGDCRDCDRRLKGDHPNLLRVDEAEVRTSGALERITWKSGNHAWSDGWLVIVIDRADRMPAEHWDALHRRIERVASGMTFILTVSDPAAAPRRGRELLLPVPLRELSVPQREELLTRACVAEGIAIDEGGLRALARIGGGRARGLLNALEAIGSGGAVTESAVRAHFRDERAEVGLTYLERVLARESLARQLAIFDEASLGPGEAGEIVRGVLAAVLGVPALGLEAEQLPAAFEGVRGRVDVGDALLARGDELGLAPRGMFSRLMQWWVEPVSDRAGLIERLNGFDEWLNGAGSVRGVARSGEGDVGERRRRTTLELRRLERDEAGGRAAGRGRGRRASSDDFLSEREVRRVWDAGSFLIQNYGLYLGARLSLCWGQGEREDEEAIGARLTDMLREMRLWMNRRWRSAAVEEPFHWVRSHVRDEAEARWTHIAMTLPAGAGAEVRAWVEKYRLRPKGPLPGMTKLKWDPARKAEDALRRHHELLGFVLAGIDQEWREKFPDEAGRGRDVEMWRILGIETPRAAGKAFTKQRTFASRYIQPEARTRAADVLPALLMFDEGAWWAAQTEWEIEEHKYRRQCEAEYRRRLSEFEVRWPPGDQRMTERRDADLEEFEARWRAEERVRVAGRPGFGKLDIGEG